MALSRDEVFREIGWQIDHLMALDTSGKGVVPFLYRAAAEQYGEPLSLRAARLLVERVKPGDTVLILTGFPSRSFLLEGVTETDGPVGAALLARVIEEVLGAVPIIVTEERVARFSANCCTVAGLLVTDAERALRSKQGPHKAACAAVVTFPTEHEEARAHAPRMLDELKPAALVAVEQPSVGEAGFAHTAAGRQITDHLLAKMDHLFTEAQRRGLLTIGIGDNGNEIGMAAIREAIHRHAPNGERICAGSRCDALLVAGNSNWGAYGLSAAIGALKSGGASVLRQIDIGAIHRRCAEDGAIDGISQRPEPKSDGTPIHLNVGVIELMAWTVETAIRRLERVG